MKISFLNSVFTLFLAFPLVADVSISTLSDWEIDTFDEETLLVVKSSEQSRYVKAILGFHVSRPHCIATHPIMMIRSERGTLSDGDIVWGQMKIDKNKPKMLKLEREFGFEEQDEDVNWMKIRKHPSFSQAERMEVKFKPTTKLDNFVIELTGLAEAKYQAEQICNSPVPIATVSRMEKI